MIQTFSSSNNSAMSSCLSWLITVVDNTKDVIDAAKDSFDTPTIPSSNAYFHGPESKYEEDNSNSSIEIKNSSSPLIEHRKRETILSENTKDNGLINTSTTITS